MKNLKLYLLVIVSSLIGFVLLFFKIFGVIQPAGLTVNNSAPLESTQVSNSEEEATSVSLSVDYGNGDSLSFEIPYQQDSTAFSVLEDALQENNIEMERENYDFGVFVKSINGLVSSQDMSWIYFVNGESGNVAANSYQLNPGDKVEWKYIAPTQN